MDKTETFSQHRPLLFSIAYRMLGSVMDAEDAVQETFLRWEQTDEDVASPKAFLSTVVTRLCIDHLRSARVQREQYVGPWLPEPIVTEETADVDEHLALADSLSMAFLVMLESLSPVERAVFLLREVFDYDYGEIAPMVDKSEANCRQLYRRARQRIADRPQRFDADPDEAYAVARRFMEATQSGDLEGVLDLLAPDAVSLSDGGGKTPAALRPVTGADKVARLFVGLATKLPPHEMRIVRVNGQPGVAIYIGARPYAVGTLEIVEGKVQTVYIVNNPEKLANVPRLATERA